MTVLISSCGNEWLNQNPDTSFSSAQDLTTKDLESLQVGMYNAIQYSNEYYAARMIYDGDIRGDDFQYKEGGASKGSSSFLYTYSVDDAVSCWEPAYYLIKTANVILESKVVDEDVADNQTVVDNIRGQAYLMRALGHFDILRSYGEFYDMNSKWGIPIINRVIPGKELATNKPPRSTVKEVYEQIVNDLIGTPDKKGAIDLMSDKKQNNSVFANSWAAKALLCRVYLYMGENQKCLDVANDIINNNTIYTLWNNSEYVSAWTKVGNSEAMLEIINTSEDNSYRESIGYYMHPDVDGNGYGAIVATLQYANLFQNGDVRKGLFFEDKKAIASNPWYGKKIFVYKYPGVVKSLSGAGFDNKTASIPVLRLSEVYLNGAEAAQKLKNGQADALLTAIVQRANPAAPPVTGANLERVLLERRLELGGEGHRFYDALRNNKVMYRDDVQKYMEEVNASGVVINVPVGIQGENEKIHPVLDNRYITIDRNNKKIIYPIPSREMKVINTDNTILEQYYKW